MRSALRHRCRVSDGFTLIELLVVIAITGMLLGMLAPALSQARRRAQSIACINNLKQLGTAITLYADDNDGRLTGLSGTYPAWSNGSPPYAWTQLIFPYIKTTKLFRDPAWPAYMPELPVSYYLNLLPAAVISNEVPITGVYTLDLRRPRFPSAFILLSEDLFISPQQEVDPTNETSDRTGFSSGMTNWPPIHAGYSNFLFCDGHVAAHNKYEDGQMTYWYDTMANWNTNAP